MVLVIDKHKKPCNTISEAYARVLLFNKMCHVDSYGFPRTSAKASKSVNGFQTGDIVKAVVTKGSKQGEYLGKVAVRSSGYFDIKTKNGWVQGIGFEYCHIVQRSDGYLYNYNECDFLSAIHHRVSIAKIQ